MTTLKVTAYKFGNVVEIFDNTVLESGFGNCIEIDGSYCTKFEFSDLELIKKLFLAQGIELSLVELFDNFVQYKVAQDPSFAEDYPQVKPYLLPYSYAEVEAMANKIWG